MSAINFNGKITDAGTPVLQASNRGYRYGDGLFETMKVKNGIIMLSGYHFDRLLSSLIKLKYEIPSLFTTSKLEQEIILLCQKNNCTNSGRVRFSVFRGNGGINDDDKRLQYLIECWPLNESLDQLNENGLIIDIYPDARKSCDLFSNLKTANFLPYSMAALYAKENKLNDCILLNTSGNIADSTIANIFLIKDGIIKTPGLEEGCINGVMRKYLIGKLREVDFEVQEKEIRIKDLQKADEVFLTNAIYGIRWVKQMGDSKYSNTITAAIYNRFFKTIPL